MAFYQRYMPVTAQPAADTSKSVPSEPQSAFFNRYIPPSQPARTGPATGSTREDSAEEQPKKRPKREEPRRLKRKDVDLGDGVSQQVDDQPPENDAKYKRVREKFKRATTGADKRKGNDVPPIGLNPPKDEVDVVKHGLEPIPQPMDIDEGPLNIETPLPDWMKQPLRVSANEKTDMADLNLSSGTLQALKKRGFNEAFAIQTAVIPLMTQGRQRYEGDICVSASTGSGKTLSYIVPMVENFRNRPICQLRGLIVVPTRELVNQVRDTLDMCAAGSKLRIGIAVGNRTMAEEKRALMEKIQVKDPVEYHRKRNMTNLEMIEEIMRTFNDEDTDDDANLGYENAWKYVPAVDILVCTPGRLVDHMRSTKGFTLEHVEMVAIDEADRLLDQSFQQWVETVVPALEALPEESEAMKAWRMVTHIWKKRRMQKIILSATITRDIGQLLSLKLKKPKLVELTGQGQRDEVFSGQTFELPATLHEQAVTLGRVDEKPLVLVKMLGELLSQGPLMNGHVRSSAKERLTVTKKAETSPDTSSDSSSAADDTSSDEDSDSASDSDVTSNSGSSSEIDDDEQPSPSQAATTCGVLIFTNTNEAALRLSRLLALLRPKWRGLTGTLTKSTESSSSRRMLSSFRNGKLSILVASDRASRGLDIKDLATVINYDMPTSVMNYVHRVGRTARAGQAGTATTIVSHHEGRWFWKEIGKSEQIQRRTKVVRREGLGKEVTEEEKHAYSVALAKLGEEARGAK